MSGFRVLADGDLVYDPLLQDDGYVITDQKLSMKVRAAGSYEFTIAPNNPAFGTIKEMVTVVTVYRGQYLEFAGRVLHCEKDFYGRKNVFVEGVYAYLNDSIVRPYTFKGSVETYFKQLIDNHNSQVQTDRQFKAGICEIEDPNNLIVRENNDYPSTRTEIENKLVGLLGGYLVPRYESGEWYLDYLKTPGETGDQVIEFGHNLLDIREYITAEDVYTCLIPLGADDGNGARVTIKSVNDGKDYLESPEGVALYGKIWRSLTWDDVTLPKNLKKRGEENLKDAVLKKTTITIGAVDLSMLGVNLDEIRAGWSYRVKSEPHGIDMYMPVSGAEIDPQNIAASTYTFGAIISTMTDRQAGQVKQSAGQTDFIVKETAEGLKKTNESLEELVLKVNGVIDDYANQSTFDEFIIDYDAQIEDFERRISILEGGGTG